MLRALPAVHASLLWILKQEGSSGVEIQWSWNIKGSGMLFSKELAKLRRESILAIPIVGWLSLLFVSFLFLTCLP